MLRAIRFIAVLLAALGLTLGAAHVLELAPKMQYDGVMYSAVTSTLYRMFGSIGAVIQIGALVAAAVLTFMVRGRPAFRLTLWGTLALVLSLVCWGSLVAPVNAQWLQVMETNPAAVPDVYLQLRARWEYGHVAAFAGWLAGFVLLISSVLAETPAT